MKAIGVEQVRLEDVLRKRMPKPKNISIESSYQRAYQYISAQYHNHAVKWRTAQQAVAHYCRARREAYGGWEQEKKVIEVLAIVLIFAYTSIQGCQLWLIRDQERRQLRAYVFPDHPVISNADDDIKAISTSPPTIDLWYKNTGATPAYNIVSVSGAALMPFPSRVDIRKLSIPTGGSVSFLPSGGQAHTQNIYVGGATNPLTKSQKQSLREGSTAIYFFGEITYYDAFGTIRCTRYEYYVGGNIGFSGSDMGNAPEGQEADTDCEQPKATEGLIELPPVPHYQF